MHLDSCRLKNGGHLVRHFTGHDIFMCVVDCRRSGTREFAVFVVGRRRAEVLAAGNKTEFRTEDECVIARIEEALDLKLRIETAVNYRVHSAIADNIIAARQWLFER